MKNITEKFEAEMAKAVASILAASHAVVIEIINEAFANAVHPGVGTASGAAQRTRAMPRRSSSSRRSGAEIAALQEQLFEAISATPGEAMSVLAPRVDATPSALQVPVARLKADGRIRTVGARQFTRYFPIQHNEAVDQAAA